LACFANQISNKRDSLLLVVLVTREEDHVLGSFALGPLSVANIQYITGIDLRAQLALGLPCYAGSVHSMFRLYLYLITLTLSHSAYNTF
jgi:hypothetical protein